MLDLLKGRRQTLLKIKSCLNYYHQELNFVKPIKGEYEVLLRGETQFLLESLVYSHYLEEGMTSNQIEAARVAINRHLKRKGKVWIRVFPHKPVTKKPAETRQGKGKGPVDHWVAVIKPGHVLFEIAGCSLFSSRGLWVWQILNYPSVSAVW